MGQGWEQKYTMPKSPAGNLFGEITCDTLEILSRGKEIERLGRKMRTSAETLERIKEDAQDQQGKAIEKLRDKIGDSHKMLAKAADLYEPVGAVISTYALDLARTKAPLNGSADECETLYNYFMSLPGEVEPRGVGGLFQPKPDSPEAAQQEEEDQAKKAASEAYLAAAATYDVYYSSWEDVFDEAVKGVKGSMEDKVEDGKWRTFFDIAGKVLGWAGMILGVAALIIGGPLVAALAAVVGILALVVVICQAIQGDKGGWDIFMGVVGVLPFGKLTSLGKLSQLRGGAFLDDALGTFKDLKGLKGLANLKGAPKEFDGLIAAGKGEWKRMLFTGKSRAESSKNALEWFENDVGPFSPTFLAKTEFLSNVIDQSLKYEGWISKVSPYDGLGGVTIDYDKKLSDFPSIVF